MISNVALSIFRSLILFIILGIAGCQHAPPFQDAPEIDKGVIDLRNWDFRKDGAVNLSGEWGFYWKELIDPSGSNAGKEVQERFFLNVPGVWNDLDIDGEKLSGEGFASLQLTVLLPKTENSFAIRTALIQTAFVLFANGKPIISNSRKICSASGQQLINHVGVPRNVFKISRRPDIRRRIGINI